MFKPTFLRILPEIYQFSPTQQFLRTVYVSTHSTRIPPSTRSTPLRSNPPICRWRSTVCNYSMNHEISRNPSPERATKRRRICSPILRKNLSDEMAAISDQPLPIIQLTPLENTLKSLLLDVADYIRERTIAEGGNAADTPRTVLRFTGGWVRDKLLGIDSHDIDVGINNMTGYQFGLLLKDYLDIPENLQKYKKNHNNGELKDAIVSLHKIEANPEKSKHLETVTTKIFGLDIDLVNLRKETYSDDSRNPQMEFGTAEEDAMRRDATINALFYNLNESKVEDFTRRGFEDMRDQVIRTPMEPYQTFKDDPLRVLRLIRFASRLGYRIDEDTENAMKNKDISEALKLKISRERVGTEMTKMLKGPDPRGALQFIDRLELYQTIFANHQDDVGVDTSSWALAYNALQELLHSEDTSIPIARVRDLLIRDAQEAYYAWVIAAFAPWSTVPDRVAQGPKAKPLPPRAAEVAKDSLRADNKTINLLRDAACHWRSIVGVKSSLLEERMSGTAAEIRQQIGLYIRTWNKDWRLCCTLAILQEVAQGGEFNKVIQEYNKFLSYLVEHNLENVYDMKPIVNGVEVAQHLAAPKGPWMSKALDMVIRWQLLHPEITDKAKALEEVSSRKEELDIRSK
ncbi:hypothetical protein BDV37DRAFT_256361 [Aspergillus pseudonomiae]|uniref:Poly A polymerase head domain-containing protein n=2 Tax=Aspergillus subgen. Circumdati TaxID=2720871 RepID=A0A5N7D3F1_9EURO|nr:uncharacterized protein BDV37DRAFT_256361 [Aspergillus pseudonomiae]KAE8400914.1 hypothetical protein BDV37DRAFT_256361 [Aspergillus pseudonomiae]